MSLGNGIDDPGMLRMESEQILLRRDLTSLVAEMRAMNERIRELAVAFSDGMGKIDRMLGKIGVIEDAVGRVEKKVGRKRAA